jgi:hypothetical protein
MERGLEEVAVEQDKAQGKKEEIRTEARSSSQKQQNWTIWSGKLEHPVSLGSILKGISRTTMIETSSTPHWCPLGLTPSQRRMIQRMRAQKLREKTVEKKRDKHFNAIRPMIPAK